MTYKSIIYWAMVMLGATNAFAQTTDTIAKVRETGYVTMGVRESAGALSYSIAPGSYGGFHVDICQRILSNLEKVLSRKVEVRYLVVTSQNRIPLVANGTVDIECGATTNNATRQKDVAFALTTYVEEVRMAVKVDSGITSVAQLNGKRVGSTTGSTSVQLLRKHKRAEKADFQEIFAKDHDETFLLLEAGRVDAFVMDSQILAGHIATNRNPKDYRITGETLSVEPIAIMLRKDDPDFKKLADNTIQELVKTGEIEKIYSKWFMRPIPPKNVLLNLPASEATKSAWANLNDKPLEDYTKK
jgi:glutamate/aspartate transport system substrate-binding protein